jgi:hypothetical protein
VGSKLANSSRAPSGAPDVLCRPIVCSWFAERRAVPHLDEHPDAPRDEVRAASEPCRLAPAVAADPAGEVPNRVEGDLRVVGARLHAEVATASGRIELVARQSRQVTQRRRAVAPEPEALVEHRRAEAERDREVGRREPSRLARVLERRQRLGPGVAEGASARHALRRGRPRPEQFAQVRATQAVGDVEGGEVQPVLRGGGDAGLVGSVEGDDLIAGVGRRRLVLAAERKPGAAGRGGESAGAERGEQRAARDGHR